MIKKYMFIPDIHGRVEKLSHALLYALSKNYHPVLIGDIVDSKDETRKNQLKCLSFLCALEENKFSFIPGNHDLSYVFPEHRATGYFNSGKNLFSKKLSKLIYTYKPFFALDLGMNSKMYWIDNTLLPSQKILVTHAGLHPRFYPALGDPIDYLNQKFHDLGCYGFYKLPLAKQVGFDSGGIYPYGGIFWLRPSEWNSTDFKIVDKSILQIVGHTQTSRITYDPKRNTVFTDCWRHRFQTLVGIYDSNKKEFKFKIKEGVQLY